MRQSIKNPWSICNSDDICHFNFDLVAHILLEISFALLIAFFVSVGIEYQARVEDLEAKERMRQEVAHDVFRGVFSKHLPSAYVDSVITHILKIDIIRTNMKIFDCFNDDLIKKDRLMLERKSVYTVKNISSSDISHNVKMAFYDDTFDELSRTGILHLQIGKRVFSKKEIDKNRIVNEKEGFVEYNFDVSIPKKQEVTVEYTAQMIKNRVDTEIFGTLYPCMKLNYSARFACKVDRMGLTARSVTPVKELVLDEATGLGDWEIDGPVLRDNSITIWWNT